MVPLLALLAAAAAVAPSPLDALLRSARQETAAKRCNERRNRDLCHDANYALRQAPAKAAELERCLAQATCPAERRADIARWTRGWLGVRDNFPKTGAYLAALEARARAGLTPADLARAQARATCSSKGGKCPDRDLVALASEAERLSAACAPADCTLLQLRTMTRALARLAEAASGSDGDVREWVNSLTRRRDGAISRLETELAALGDGRVPQARERIALLHAVAADLRGAAPKAYERWSARLNAASAAVGGTTGGLRLPASVVATAAKDKATGGREPEPIGAPEDHLMAAIGSVEQRIAAAQRIGSLRRRGDPEASGQLVTRQLKNTCVVNSAMQILRSQGRLPEGTGEPELLAVANEHGYFQGEGTANEHLASLLRHYGVAVRQERGAGLEALRAAARERQFKPFMITVDAQRYLGTPTVGGRGASHAIVVTGALLAGPDVLMYYVNDSDADPPVRGGAVPPIRLEPAFETDGGNLILPF